MNHIHRDFPVLGESVVKMEDTLQPDGVFAFCLFLQLLYDLPHKYLSCVAQKRELYIFCMEIVGG